MSVIIVDIFRWLWQFLFELWAQLQAAPNPAVAGLILFFNGGWIFVLLILWQSGKDAWIQWRWELYHEANRRFILLAIDVPRDNEQSPRAVENIFTHLHGILPGRNNLYEQWWLGKTVDFFSVELVSIDGYVQFLVHTQVEYRDLVESAFYAQYPDAEITQVEDYVYGANNEFRGLRFPNDQYNLQGCEFTLAKSNSYPIRLYTEFEHALSQEYKDPMAALLESMNNIGPGEQIWFQWVITPEYDYNWQPAAHNAALKIAGKAVEEAPGGVMDRFLGGLLKWLDALGVAAFPFYNATPEADTKNDLPSLMLHLTPTEKAQVEGIQKKADKVAFWTKFRFINIAKKEIFTKAHRAPVSGVIKQFGSLNLNGFIAHKYTKTWGLDYLFVPWRTAARQNKLLRAFQNRSRSTGSYGIILNVEELASIYHFPGITVKAPLVSRTEAKRASAPMALPLETPSPFLGLRPKAQAPKGPAPTELPLPAEETPPLPVSPEPAGVPENLPFV